MSVDITSIGIGVDTSKLKTGTRDLDSFGASADKASRKADGLTGATENLSGSFSALARLLPVLGLATLATNFVRASDEMIKMNAQLRNATTSQKEFNEATRNVAEIAKRAQADIGSIGTTYARLSNALRDVGANQKQVSNVTETLALALKVNGATAAETTSTMLQLSQAFGKGKLDGDEFRTAMEAAPNVMRELAKSIGVPFGALKDLAAQGGLTSEVMLKAFNNPELLESLRKQAEQTETVNGAWQNFTNSLTLSLGKINEVTGASKILIGVLDKAATLLSVFRGGEDGSIVRNFLDGGNKAIADKAAAMSTGELKQAALWYSWAREALKARQELSAGMTLGGMSPNGSIAPNFSSTVVAEDINKIHQQQEEALRIKTDAQKKYDAMRKKSNDEALKDIQDSIDEETEMIDAKNSFELKSLKAIEKQKEDDYKQQLKRLDELQDMANANFKAAQDAYKKEQDEVRKEFEKTLDRLNTIFSEGFANLINGGKSSWKAFTKNLFTNFKTAVADQIYKLFAKPFVVSLVAAISGVGISGAANAAVGTIGADGNVVGGVGDLYTSVKNLSSTIQGGLQTSIEGLGSYIANLGGADSVLGSLGGAIGQYSSTIASALPYAGALIQAFSGNVKGAAFTAAGAAIGSFIPGIGTAIGAVIGSFVGGLFGGNDKGHRSGAGVGTSYNNGVFATNVVGKGTATKFDASYVDPLRGLSQQFATELGTLLNYFGQQANIYLGADFKAKQKGGKGDTKGEFGGTVNGVRFFSNFTYDQKDTQAFQSYVNSVLGTTLVTAIQSSDLSNGIKKFFNGLTAKEDVLNTINTLTTLSTALKDLPPVFQAIKSAIDNTELKINASQLQQSFNNIGTYTGLFYTQSENFSTFTKQLNSTFAGLNITLPETREGFRALVDGIDTTTTSGLGLFNALVSLAPTADAYYKSLQAQADATKQATDNAYALADALNTNNFKNVVDFTRAQRYQENGIPLSLLPSYDVGTSYVPSDGPAMLHQGEAVLTRAENAARNSGGNGEIKGLLVDLIQEIRRTSLPQIQAVQKMAKILDRIDEDGIVISETDRSGERVTLDTRVVA